MSAVATASDPRLATGSRRGKAWRIIPELDKDERIIAQAQTPIGRAILLLVSAVFLHTVGENPVIAGLAGACAYGGRYRWPLISLATLAISIQHGFWIDARLIARVADQESVNQIIILPVLLHVMPALAALLFVLVLRAWPKTPTHISMGRSTTLTTLLFVGLILLAQSPICTGVARVLIWAFLMTVLPYLWYLGYALAESSQSPKVPIWRRMTVFHPFWGGSLTPFGKMTSYLQKYEAKTTADLAVTQLKGVKLLAWMIVVLTAANIFRKVFYRYLGVPLYEDTFAHFCSGSADSWAMSWVSLILSFFYDMMTVTMWGGAIVGVARLAGFRLPRNTYNPMGAKTITEFWNRYYYFFKELLVDFFFYPTFFTFFRKRKKLRLFFATFMSACVGNLLFHFLRDIHFIAEMGLANALAGEASHAFYTFLLAIGIFVSQIYPRRVTQPRGWVLDQAAPFLRVLMFFSVLHVFDAPSDREHSFLQHVDFLLYLFGGAK
jgi:hypothetical protein